MPKAENDEVWRAYDNGLTIRRRVESRPVPAREAQGAVRTTTVPCQVFDLVGPSTTIEVRDERLSPAWDRVPRRIRFCDAIFEAVDIEDLCPDPAWVPTTVAVRGPPYIATFLAGVHGEGEIDIAERLGVTKPTVVQYLSDVTAGRR